MPVISNLIYRTWKCDIYMGTVRRSIFDKQLACISPLCRKSDLSINVAAERCSCIYAA